MLRTNLLGGAVLASAMMLAQGAMAQQIVSSSDCNSGNCNGAASGQCVGGQCGGFAHGANTHGLGARAGWVYHSSWGDYWARNQASQRPWHGGYYWMRTGQPTALVVPPTVTMQSNYSWGVSQNTMTPVYHQFGGVPPNGAGGGVFRATPYWPTHTDQFGVYPVRGPW